MRHGLDICFFLLLVVAWLVAYFALLRGWLRSYHQTAGIMARIEVCETGGWARLRLKLKGARSALLLCLTSLFTGGWGLVEALFGLDPSALAPFQDSTLWKAVLQDEMALRAAAIATFASAILVLRGRLHDIRIVPQPEAAAASTLTPTPTVGPAAGVP